MAGRIGGQLAVAGQGVALHAQHVADAALVLVTLEFSRRVAVGCDEMLDNEIIQ